MAATIDFPLWDLEVLFPSLDSAEFTAALADLQGQVAGLQALFDAESVSGSQAIAFSPEVATRFEKVVSAYNHVQDRMTEVGAYVYGMVSGNTRNQLAQATLSRFEPLDAEVTKLMTRLVAWLGCLPFEQLLEASEVARSHQFALKKAKVDAEHLLSPTEETLVADLNLYGAYAWPKLRDNVTSQIEADVALPSGTEWMTMTQIRNLAFEADREVRRAGFEAEQRAWKHWEVPIAAAMNSIKGQVNYLAKRRGWSSPLDVAVFQAHMDRETLDAMLGAARNAFPVFRRYLKAKAKNLGLEKLAFFDIFAPLAGEAREWKWVDACNFVASNFDKFSRRMGDMARRSVAENWTDVGPRPGKRDGAFCMGFRNDESRILMNFRPSFESVSTYAHELGHAYHNLCLYGRTFMQKDTPMTLAETASIFCETIVKRAAIREMSDAEQLEVLEKSLEGATQVVVDISSRFQFEKATFEAREDRELSSDELCQLMRQAQLDTYGDGLDSNLLHPYMWAAKPHYYSSSSYYNFPYMFGLLFGTGLYAQYLQAPEPFVAKYDDLLSSTGLDDAAGLAARFGIDIRTSAFWDASLGQFAEDVERFEALVS